MNEERQFIDEQIAQQMQNWQQDQRMQDIEQNYNVDAITNRIHMTQVMEDTEYDISTLRKKIKRTQKEIIVVIIILIIILLYKFWYPALRDYTPLGKLLKWNVVTDTIHKTDVVDDTPDDDTPVDDNDTDEDIDVPFNNENEAYMVNLKLSTPQLSLSNIKKYNTKDLKEIAKDKKKQVICSEFYSDVGEIYTKASGNTKYYSFDDVLDQVDAYTERISLTQVTSEIMDGKSHYTNYELIYNMEVGAAAIYNENGDIEFYGYSKETVDDFKQKLEDSKQTVNHDGIMISVNGSGVNPNRVSQAIAQAIPSVKYLNYDATYIGLELEKGKIIYRSFEGDKDITDKVISAVKSVSGVEEVIVGNEDADMKFCITTDITIPNDLALIIENHLY